MQRAKENIMAKPEELSSDEIRGHYQEFTRQLIGRLNELVPRQDQARVNLDEQLLDAPGDDADSSVADTSADYFLNMANAHRQEIIDIREALDRMERGIYGVCEECGLPISIERLRRLITARLCIDCQSSMERKMRAAFPRLRPKL